jgi:hypothetical protein
MWLIDEAVKPTTTLPAQNNLPDASLVFGVCLFLMAIVVVFMMISGFTPCRTTAIHNPPSVRWEIGCIGSEHSFFARAILVCFVPKCPMLIPSSL